MSAAWADLVLHRPQVTALLDTDPVVDLEDCRLVSVTTDGARVEPLHSGGLPLSRHGTVSVEVATPAAATGREARVVRFLGTEVLSYAVVGVLDGRPGTLRVERPRPRNSHRGTGDPEPVWLSFHAEQTRLRIQVEVLELDSVRTDLAAPLPLPRVAGRVAQPAPGRMTIASCAVGDIDGPLELALSRRPGWTREVAMAVVERLCAGLDADYDPPDGDEEWVVLGARSPSSGDTVAIAHLFTPLVVFTDDTAERHAHDRALLPPDVVPIGVPSYTSYGMRADSDLIDRLTRSSLRDEMAFDDAMFSPEDLWFEGT